MKNKHVCVQDSCIGGLLTGIEQHHEQPRKSRVWLGTAQAERSGILSGGLCVSSLRLGTASAFYKLCQYLYMDHRKAEPGLGKALPCAFDLLTLALALLLLFALTIHKRGLSYTTDLTAFCDCYVSTQPGFTSCQPHSFTNQSNCALCLVHSLLRVAILFCHGRLFPLSPPFFAVHLKLQSRC